MGKNFLHLLIKKLLSRELSNKFTRVTIVIASFLLIIQTASSQKIPDYKNPKLPIEKRVEDLISRMTLEEKSAQLRCTFKEIKPEDVKPEGLGNLASVFGTYTPKEAAKKYNELQKAFIEKTRLGIPILMHGEAVFGLMANKMTSFPQPICQASTWNPALQEKMSTLIAQETKSRGYVQVLSPTINVAYDPRWGRTHETYGEDPLLVSKMGVAFIKGMEKNGVITTPKHFAANIGHSGKFGEPVDFSERFLREVELPPFKAAVQEGGATSMMPAYNTISGVPCVSNTWLLDDILRKEWGFKGFLVSDYGAIADLYKRYNTAEGPSEAAVQALSAGTDIELVETDCYGEALIQAVKTGKISEASLDQALRRYLFHKFKIGLFENPYVDPEQAAKICDAQPQRELAREIARQGMVLLKNDNNILPLNKNIKTLAVLGPLADNLLLGNYAGWGMKKVSILEGVKNKLGNSTQILFEKGVELTQLALPSISSDYLFVTEDGKDKNGVKAEYFNNIELSGKPVLTRIEPNIDYEWGDAVPHPFVNNDKYSVRWTAKLIAPATGKFNIGVTIDDGARLYINDKLVIDDWKNGSVRLSEASYHFEKGKSYNIRLEYFEGGFNATARLGWNAVPNADIPKAVALAQKADATIIVVGALDGEGTDRADLDLTQSQEDLINAVAATGKPFTVILASGNVITMHDWVDKAPSILEAWYSGEEGGNAVADILFGDYNPGGKLPITFVRTTGQVPNYYHKRREGAASTYISYGNDPIFPFGHGLSYTKFDYTNLKLSANPINQNQNFTLSLDIKNTGTRKGDEVVQVYVKDQISSIVLPDKMLKAFERITLNPGETKTITFTITPDDLSFFNINLKRVQEPGKFDIMVGGSSEDIRLQEVLVLK